MSAFSLIELLVVLAILGVLSALLLAALPNVLKKKDDLKCLSNVRQLGLAFQLYASENNQTLPVRYADTWVKPAAYGGIWDYLYPNKSWDKYYPIYARTIFRCPELERRNIQTSSYAMNVVVGGNYTLPVYLTRIDRKAEVALLIEARSRLVQPSGGVSPDNDRHSGNNNIVYMDFHVETLKTNKIPTYTQDLFWIGK